MGFTNLFLLPDRRLRRRCGDLQRLLAAIALVVCLGGCQALGAVSMVSKVADFALQASGIKKDGAAQPKLIDLHMEASDHLNADPAGRPLSVVTRIYKLRDPNGFLQAPYEVFGNTGKEKQAFGTDVVEVRELLLIPGQRYDTKEKITSDTAYLGVVALFRSPGSEPWRLTIAQAELEKNGAAIALDGCSLRRIDPSAEPNEKTRRPLSCH